MSVLIGVLSTKTQRKRTKNTIILVFIVVAIVIVTVVIKVVELVVEIVVVVVVVVVIVVVNVVVLVIVIVVQYDAVDSFVLIVCSGIMMAIVKIDYLSSQQIA